MNFLAFRLTLWPDRYQGGRLQQACALQFSAFIAKIACEIGDPMTLVFLFAWMLKDQFKTLVFLVTHLRMVGKQLRYCLMFLRAKIHSSPDRTSRSLNSHLLLATGIALRSDFGCSGFYPVGFWKPLQLETAELVWEAFPSAGLSSESEFFSAYATQTSLVSVHATEYHPPSMCGYGGPDCLKTFQ